MTGMCGVVAAAGSAHIFDRAHVLVTTQPGARQQDMNSSPASQRQKVSCYTRTIFPTMIASSAILPIPYYSLDASQRLETSRMAFVREC
jgi:hypothetical protein